MEFNRNHLARIASSVLLEKAENLLSEKRVRNFFYDREQKVITGRVFVSNKISHLVRIQLINEKSFKHECTCFLKQSQPCTHALAVLLYFIQEIEKKEEYRNKTDSQQLVSVYSNTNLSSDFNIVQQSEKIKATLNDLLYSPIFSGVYFDKMEQRYKLHLLTRQIENNKIVISLKLKNKNGIRFVPNIEDFFKSLNSNNPIFINNSEYLLKREYFDHESLAIYDNLKDIILNHDSFLNFNQREIALPVYISKRLIDNMYQWENVYNYDGNLFFIKNHNWKPGIKIDLEFNALSVKLIVFNPIDHRRLEKPLLFFTNCSIYLNYNSYFYHLMTIDKQLLQILSYINSNIYISEELAPNFLLDILPLFEDKITIIRSSRMNKIKLHKAQPKPKIYLEYDKLQKTILAKLTILYDQFEVNNVINPLSDNKVIFEKGQEQFWVVRDYLFEKKIYSKLKKWHFESVDFDVYKLSGDQSIFHFMFDVLPNIKNDWEIHYHSNFASLNIMNSHSPSVNVSLAPTINYFEVMFQAPGNNINIPLEKIANLKNNQRFIKLGDNDYLPIKRDTLKVIKEIMREFDSQEINSGQVAISKGIYILNRLKEHQELALSADRRSQDFFSQIKSAPKLKLSNLPERYLSCLRDYQKDGLYWIINLSSFNLGMILADDMGLGKTVQAIGSVLFDYYNGEKKSSIVICPTSLLYNWKNEIEKFAPDISYQIISGKTEERINKINNINQFVFNITSYAMLRNDIEKYNNYNFNYIILDEAQLIKNPATRNAKAAKTLISNKRLILTGTPIENCISELWSLFDFLMPGFLYSHNRFRKLFEKPIVIHHDNNVKNILVSRISPFILRRLKKDVLKDLPPKIEQVYNCELSELEKQIYVEYLNQAKDRIKEIIQEKNIKNAQFEILSVLMRLRQICCHTELIGIKDHHGKTVISSKLELLKELTLEAIEANHKVLIFSQFVSMLDIIKKEFESLDIRYEYLTGSVKDRIERVDRFNQNEDISTFLISLKAGGTGLNLTSADIVIHYDPWWNPSVENQASDRAHRIGQSSQVLVYKLITVGTIEEKIMKLQNTKKDLISSIITEDISGKKLLSFNDVKELFEISDDF